MPGITRIVKFIRKGADGRSIVGVDVEYADSTSNDTAPTSGWSTQAPLWQEGHYIWSRTRIDYSTGESDYTDPVCITGSTGNPGESVVNIEEEYYRSSSAYYLSGGSWSTTRWTWMNGYYIWTRSHIYLTDRDYYTTPICITGAKGNNGTTYYTWIKYAQANPIITHCGMTDTPDANTAFIGIAKNKTTATESNDVNDYTWTKIKGEDGQSIKVDGTIDDWKPSTSGYDKIDAPKWAVDNPFSLYYWDESQEQYIQVTPTQGTMYVINAAGESTYKGHLLVADGGQWRDLGNLQGQQGPQGPQGQQGPQGPQGPSLRGPQNWDDVAVGYQFYAGGSNEPFKDVVIWNGNYYSCTNTHVKTSTNYPTSDDDDNSTPNLWTATDKVEIVATQILLATYALVKNLGVEAIEMKDDGGNILFQAKDGAVTCKTGNFENVNVKNCKIDGIIASPFVVENSTITYWADGQSYYAAKAHDNLLYNSAQHHLYWTPECSGRLITLCHHESVTGSTTFTAPSGMYFYEAGMKRSSITVSRQCVILKGYGTANTFLGYIVVKRIDLATTRSYGRDVKCLAMGVVNGNTSGSVTINYRTFENNANSLSVSKVSTGVYRVTIPTAWNIQNGKLRVMVSGLGDIYNGSNALWTGVRSIEANSSGVVTAFTVQCGDDTSRNDGDVQFMLFNQADWELL